MTARHDSTPAGLKELSDLPGYGITPDGIAWTRKLVGTRPPRLGPLWRPLSPATGKHGHRYVNLSHRGRQHKRFIHRMVLEAFGPPRLDGQECCHYDGDAGNNRIENLRWDTHAGNVKDTMRHGRVYRRQGSEHDRAILGEGDIPEIFRMRADGFTPKQIAAKYSVVRVVIYDVLKRKSWKHVPIPPEVLR